MNPPNQDPSQLKTITEELYKKNLELVTRNQTLALLQKLYEIIVASNSLEDISHKFKYTIVTDLQLVSGVVALYNQNLDQLQISALTKSAFDQTILNLLNIPTKNLIIPSNALDNVFYKVQHSKKQMNGKDILEVYGVWLTRDHFQQAQDMAKQSNINAIYVYPILFGTELLGVYALFSQRSESELSAYETMILFELATVFGLALNKAILYQDLQNANNKLRVIDKRKDEFLSIATHELRAPMTAIKGYISMLLDGDAGKLPTEAESFLKVAQSSTDRLIRLVNNMLNVARIEEGRQVYQMGIIHLIEVVNTIYGEFKIDAEKKKLEYVLDINANINDSVYVDLDRIHEVVANLISNGIKYTESGRVTIKLFHPDQGGRIIRLEVIDTGKGIATEDQQQLFQKYYRVQDRMERKTGTGLGLYISKVLIEKFNGKIGFISEIGKGSTFWFELPVVENSEGMPKVIT